MVSGIQDPLNITSTQALTMANPHMRIRDSGIKKILELQKLTAILVISDL